MHWGRNYAGRAASLGLLALACLACGGSGEPSLSTTRGVILISLDTLRADRVSAYGYERPTSPFLDSLAARGARFARATAPYPATLVSHMSMFTGLYPPQHGVYPPNKVLGESVWTVTEALRQAGFRTAAHTEGGYVAKGYGFERGFETYDDSAYGGDGDIEETFGRGIEFLDGLAEDEKFYLFLHSYSVHDPYDPPRFVAEFDGDEPVPSSAGERLRDFNFGRETIELSEVRRFSDRYDASVRYVDAVLEGFVAQLEARGLLAETTLVITSDHGEEFLEHGKLAHTQVYPEALAVPLVIVHPELSQGREVEAEVNLIDLAPTIAELAGQPVPEGLLGRSLVPYMLGRLDDDPRLTYAEVKDGHYMRSLTGDVGDVRHQLVAEGIRADLEGTWVERRVEFDMFGPKFTFRSRSFHEPRQVTVRVGDEVVGELVVTPDWGDFTVTLGVPGLTRVTLEADGCRSPLEVGESGDARCLGLIIQGPPLLTVELFDLEADPLAQVDLSRDRPLVTRRMMRELQSVSLNPVGSSLVRELSDDERQRLRDLGYLD